MKIMCLRNSIILKSANQSLRSKSGKVISTDTSLNSTQYTTPLEKNKDAVKFPYYRKHVKICENQDPKSTLGELCVLYEVPSKEVEESIRKAYFSPLESKETKADVHLAQSDFPGGFLRKSGCSSLGKLGSVQEQGYFHKLRKTQLEDLKKKLKDDVTLGSASTTKK